MSDRRFRDDLPNDRWYDVQRDMWVKQCADEQLEIGATALGLRLAGDVIAFTPKPQGAEIERGRGLGTMETGKTVLAIHCPVSLRMTSSNEEAEANPSLLDKSPYNAGWMVRGTTNNWVDELKDLVDADAYRQHCLSVIPDAEIIVIA